MFPVLHQLFFQKFLMLGQFQIRSATEKVYQRKSVQFEDVSTECKWTFQLVLEKRLDVPFYGVIGFIQRDQFHQQT